MVIQLRYSQRNRPSQQQLKYLIIATLAGIFLVIVYSRLRPYIQLVRKVLTVIGGSAGSNSSVSSQSRKATVNAEHKLIRCVSCGTWIPADRAITLNAGLSTYCSRECLEKKATAKERKLAG